MSYSDIDEAFEDEFYRWFVGGSPPEADAWPRDAFESALRQGSPQVATHADETGDRVRSPA